MTTSINLHEDAYAYYVILCKTRITRVTYFKSNQDNRKLSCVRTNPLEAHCTQRQRERERERERELQKTEHAKTNKNTHMTNSIQQAGSLAGRLH